jgi:PIN domain nuclease of toxin-antitoxin system
VRRTLIDTECWLWWHLAPDRLGSRALAILEERRSALLLSAASAWEIAIKVGLGRLTLPAPPDRFVPEQLGEDGIEPLPSHTPTPCESPVCPAITSIRSTGCWSPRPTSSAARS